MKKEIKKKYTVSMKGLPKEMRKYIPKSTDTNAMWLLVPFYPQFKATGVPFAGFDALPTTQVICELKFERTQDERYMFIGVNERMYDSFSFQTIWTRFYPSYEYYRNATI